MRYFGPEDERPVGLERVETPRGACAECAKPFGPGERGVLIQNEGVPGEFALHHACFLEWCKR